MPTLRVTPDLEMFYRVDDIGFRRPTLDEVFLTLTGHAAEETPKEDAA